MRKIYLVLSFLTAFLAVTDITKAQSVNIAGPLGSQTFGITITVLTNGNYVIVDPYFDDGAITDVGAVYLYNGSTHALISTLKGSAANDNVGNFGVVPLSNGNYVVRSPLWSNGAATGAGAATWCNGTTGINGIVSITNSLVGTTLNDNVGIGIIALTNGNYIVRTSSWDNGAVVNAGAVTWGNGTTGISGIVSSANSLVGTVSADNVGSSGIVVLTNGNYVVCSSNWDNGAATNAGAVTWGNGTTGISGIVSSANSLVGTTINDLVGNFGITALANGNYVVRNSLWNNGAAIDAGAVTWGSGTAGISGIISSGNSLVGTTSNDNVGNEVIALTNGNYVVRSTTWDNGAVTNAGAVTWGNGTTGISGIISSASSLVGTTSNDQVGYSGVYKLTNGNYVINSPTWNNGAAMSAGAVTWGNGTTGISGIVSSTNSLVGSTTNDFIGQTGVTALTNGNYVVASPEWDNGAVIASGAATWCNGITGTTGAVSSSNSLVGKDGDRIGNNGVTALTNGNYVVTSYSWSNTEGFEGAVTWGNGVTGTTGLVTSSNSLVGSSVIDRVGNGGVVALSNGNYVVRSSEWGIVPIQDIGAVTWGNGATGTSGIVSAANSLIGSTPNDAVGNGGITALSNGNYVVTSFTWANGAVINAGAATFGNGTTGVAGVVNAANSLVGSTANDQVSMGGIIALNNGNYVVRSYNWDNGILTDAGAATWGNGSTGVTGAVNSSNSLVGSTAFDAVGIDGITALSNGSYTVHSTSWDNGAVTNVGAISLGNGSTGVAGNITSCNSVLGGLAGNGFSLFSIYNSVSDNLIVARPNENIVTIYNPATLALANSLDAVTININGTNAIPLIASGACRIIATLTPNGGTSAIKSTVNAKVWIETSVPVFNVLPYVARHYEINPTTNAATATGRVTLYFTQQEFDDFNADPGSFWNLPANAADATGKANLRIARYAGTSSNGSGLPGSYTPGALVIDPVDSDIVWNSTLSRWEVSFDVTGFGGFIVQTALYPLAVALDFTGRLQNNNALVNWQTTNEINMNSFVLERSTDGRNYAAVYTVAAHNTAGNNQYNFTDPAIDALNVAVVYYRIKQVAAAGRFTHSNIVALSASGKNIVLLYPNPVEDKANLVITVNNLQQVQYRIIDNTGRIIAAQKRNIISGSNTLVIDVSGLPKGMYWIELKGETMNERKLFIKK